MTRFSRCITLFGVAYCSQLVFADELLHRYEADVLPYDPSTGWELFDPCDRSCSESLDQGFFLLTYPPSGGSSTNYTRVFGGHPLPPPPDPPFWVEWRYASNNAVHGFLGGDGAFVVGYNTAGLYLEMYGDAIISGDGGSSVSGLPLNEFRTFRFESPDANQWCVWYDGKLFRCEENGRSPGLASHVQMYGFGESPYQTVNRWDYVRYGRVTTGETIVASDPPAGFLDPTIYSGFDRFTVTFNQPNYVYLSDIAVEVLGSQQTAAGSPVIIATRRQDNGPPETVEIVLDRPLPVGTTTRFTFNTDPGAPAPQVIEYSIAVDPHPIIPTVSAWGLLILTLLLIIAAKLAYFTRPLTR